MSDAPVRPTSSSLTWRLAWVIGLLLLAGGAIVTLSALAYGRQAAQGAYDRLLLGSARQMAASTSVQAGQVVADIPLSAFDLLTLSPDDRVIYRIVGPGGTTLTGYDELTLPRGSEAVSSFHNLDFRGEPVRVVALNHRFAERAFSGTIVVLVGQTMQARQALARELARGAVLTVALAGVCMSGLALFAVYSALQPLRRIERSFVERDPNDLTPLQVSVPRELGPVVSAINRFMARLSGQMSIMNNLIADSAHQLRTPVAALRAQAELATEEQNPVALANAVQRIHQRSISLARLTDQLLSRALVSHRADSAMRTILDLRTVAIDAAEECDVDRLGQRQDLHLNLPEESVLIRGDALSLREACKNLVNNAFVHGATPVTLAVRCDARHAQLVVSDNGSGIPECEWASAGMRFTSVSTVGSSARIPNSRGGDDSVRRHTRGQVSGLGLAIVQSVAEAHTGGLRFSHAVPQGFEVAVWLPLATPGPT